MDPEELNELRHGYQSGTSQWKILVAKASNGDRQAQTKVATVLRTFDS